VQRTAERLVADRALRERFPAVRDFFARATRQRLAAAGQGIVCAGSRLDEVRVAGNSLDGVLEGIRVAVSHDAPRDAPPDIVGSLEVSGNRIALRVPLDRSRGDQAVQIGNAHRAVISRNEVTYAPEAKGQTYGAGLDMVGFYGPFVLIAENMVQTQRGQMRVAIRMRHAAGEPGRAEVLWRAVGNLAVGFGDLAFLFPAVMRSADNLAAPG
jgi:hypothetical protein